ncbi:M20/M25/M40 family metallo-hydrolase, partial [Streptomyces formicae]
LLDPESDSHLPPATALSTESGELLRRDLASGAVDVHVDVEHATEEAESFNVIATHRDAPFEQVVGAHLDSVAAGPGINDNASGVAALLEAARRSPASARWAFCWWGAEEVGLHGSRHFVENLSQRSRTATLNGYINLDMAASPNYAIGVYGDTPSLEALLTSHFKDIRQPWVPIEGGVSDHFTFAEAGVPVAGLAAWGAAAFNKTEKEAEIFGGTAGEPYDPNFHSDRDDLANIDWTALEICSTAMAVVTSRPSRAVR